MNYNSKENNYNFWTEQANNTSKPQEPNSQGVNQNNRNPQYQDINQQNQNVSDESQQYRSQNIDTNSNSERTSVNIQNVENNYEPIRENTFTETSMNTNSSLQSNHLQEDKAETEFYMNNMEDVFYQEAMKDTVEAESYMNHNNTENTTQTESYVNYGNTENTAQTESYVNYGNTKNTAQTDSYMNYNNTENAAQSEPYMNYGNTENMAQDQSYMNYNSTTSDSQMGGTGYTAQSESNTNYNHINNASYIQENGNQNYDESVNTQQNTGGTGSDIPPKKSNSGKKFLQFVAAAAVFGVVAGCSFMGINQAADYMFERQDSKTVTSNKKDEADNSAIKNDAQSKKDNVQSGVETTIPSTPVVADSNIKENDVTQVVKSTMPSIVSITGTFKQTGYSYFGQYVEQEVPGSGSGIIVGKNDTELLIVTNNHVISGAENITVSFIDEETAEAEIKGTDSTEDLAVIAIKLSDISEDTLNQIRIATLGDSDLAEVGEKVVAIGNALGYGQSVTVGYISAKNRTVSVDNREMELLQTDAAINPGNSGGALLNTNGDVIGINSVKYTQTSVEGIGYAIPISKATPIINELMNREQLDENEKGYLGITMEEVTTEENEMNMPSGIFVSEVSEKGAAKEAGIMQGDIITKVNGMQVKTRKALKEKVNSYRVGTKVTLTVMRYEKGEYVEKDIEVTLKAIDSLGELDNSTQDSSKDSQDNKKKKQQEPDSNTDEYESIPDISDEYDEFFKYFFGN